MCIITALLSLSGIVSLVRDVAHGPFIFLYLMCLQEKFDGLSALVAVIDWAKESVLPWIHSAEEEVKVQRKRSVTSSASRHDLCLQILKVHIYEHALGTRY